MNAWRAQHPRPFIVVIDTGSTSLKSQFLLKKLGRWRGVEVARLGIECDVEHLSDRVAIALDYAFSRCPTNWLLSVHVDMFPKHRDLIAKLQGKCDVEQPVVGWEMSPRGSATTEDDRGYLSDGIPGHVCTMFFMPVMDRIGAGWSMRRAHHAFGLPRTRTDIRGWPDTEVCLGRLLEIHGIKPLYLGRETNIEVQETEDWVHARSSTWHFLMNGHLPLNHISAFESAQRRIRRWKQSAGAVNPSEKSESARPPSLPTKEPELSVCLPLSGRASSWPRLEEFLERQSWPTSDIRLIVIDSSQSSEFSRTVRNWMAGSRYLDYRYVQLDVGQPGLADLPRSEVGQLVQMATAVIYRRVAREARTKWLAIVEDDVIPPEDAFRRLRRAFKKNTISVSGTYRSRHRPAFVAWDDFEKSYVVPGRGVTEVGGNGFGCVMMRGSFYRRLARASLTGTQASDAEFYRAAKSEGLKAKVDWDIECTHIGAEVAP